MTETALDDLRRDVRATVRGWLGEGIFTPRCDGWNRGWDRDFSRRLAERGWVGMTVPTEYGGPGGTALERFVVAEELLAVGAPVSAHWVAERQMVPMLLHTGTEEQRRRLLPGIARAEITFAIGMSEPNSGSDLASVRTRAHHEGDHWLLSGQKIWSTAAHLADRMVVLCRTEGTSQDRHSGLSQLLVDLRSPEIEVRPIRTMNRQAEFCEVFFNDLVVPDADVIGTIGHGWQQVMAELSFERSGPDRYMSTFPILDRWLSGEPKPPAADVGVLVAELVALRALSMGVVESQAAGRPFGADAALCKDAGTRFEQRSIDLIRDDACVGSETGALWEMLDDMTLSAPIITLRGGTTEILRGITARGLTA
jgi:hypothetical protein